MLRAIPALLLCLATLACAGSRDATLEVSGTTARGVPARFQPLFEALRDAVAAGEDDSGRRIALRLRALLELEAAAGGGRPARDALELLEGFERILRGRELVDGLDLELAVRTVPGEPLVTVLLLARTRDGERSVLRPNGALLRLHKVTLAETGREHHTVRTQAAGTLQELELDGELAELVLGTAPTVLPGNALAARTRWRLELNAGEVERDGLAYPAQEVPVAAAERVELAAFLPNTPVDPAALAAYVERPEVALAPILERTVRIAPERREEALDRLTPVVLRSPHRSVERLVPSLRWLSGTGDPGRDPLAWREWMRARAERRRSQAADGPLDFSGR